MLEDQTNGGGGPRRKYTSKACEECRRRKAKCDGQRPTCSRCVARKLTCHFDTGEDGRKPAPKSYVQLLRARIDVLESALTASGIDVSAALQNVSGEANLGILSEDSPHDASSDGIGTPEDDDLSNALEGALSVEDSLNYEQDGQSRYYGSTSGRLAFRSLRLATCPLVPCAVLINNSRDRERGMGRQAQFNSPFNVESYLNGSALPSTDIPLDQELQDHLVDLYFKWQNPWTPLVNERLFRESERTGGPFTSPLLLASILALGCRYSDRSCVRQDPNDPSTAGGYFLAKSETLLHSELLYPNITTIQASAIMQAVYVSMGSDSAGWLHHGMASRLALDMGLNLDAAGFAKENGMSMDEVELRRQIYWALYCDDKFSALNNGRVCSMLTWQGAAKLPTIPHDIASQKSEIAMSLSVCPRAVGLLQHAVIRLCQILEKILVCLYAPRMRSRVSERIPLFDSCILELRNWYYDLPAEFKVDNPGREKGLPQAYTLLMMFHTTIIILAKPFLKPQGVTIPDLSKRCLQAMSPSEQAAVKKGTEMCNEASLKIIQISRKYQQTFGSFRRSAIIATYSTLLAAIVLLDAEVTNSVEGTKSVAGEFDVACQVMEELGTAWTLAGRLRRNLIRLKDLRLGTQSAETIPDPTKPLPGSNFGMVVDPDFGVASFDFIEGMDFNDFFQYDAPV